MQQASPTVLRILARGRGRDRRFLQRLQLVASKAYLVPASLAAVHVFSGGLSWTLLDLDADLGALGAQAAAPSAEPASVSFSQYYTRLLCELLAGPLVPHPARGAESRLAPGGNPSAT
jgi:hypothetical protein